MAVIINKMISKELIITTKGKDTESENQDYWDNIKSQYGFQEYTPELTSSVENPNV